MAPISDKKWKELHDQRSQALAVERKSTPLVEVKSSWARWTCAFMAALIAIGTISMMTETYNLDHFLKSLDSVSEVSQNQFQIEKLDEKKTQIKLQVPQVKTSDPYTLWIPIHQYQSAEIYMGSALLGSCYKDNLCLIQMPLNAERKDILCRITSEHSGDRILTSEPAILFQSKDTDSVRNFLFEKKSQSSRRISVIVRIVLAIFCIVLFLAVERSPETLALSLFTGLEAIALLMGFNGLRPSILPEADYTFLKQVCWSLADVFRLFFCFQIARTWTANIKPWVIVGVLLCIPYGFIRHNANRWGVPALHDLWIYKDLAVSAIGAVICFRALLYVRKLQLNHRIFAIALVLVGLISEFGNAAFALVPSVFEQSFYSTILGFFESNSAFLFCLGTILNISNLEQRVKRLTAESLRAQELKNQLELATSLQKSFMGKPELPENFSIWEFYKPASYVGGDMYFIHWDEARKSAVILLNDVVGHGVSAALKAFGAHMIAKSIWRGTGEFVLSDSENRRGDTRRVYERREEDSKLRQFDRLINQLSTTESHENEFTAFVGVEFNFVHQVVSIYRMNHIFPIVVDLHANTVSPIAMTNQKVVTQKIKAGQMLLLLSDGVMTSIRDLDAFASQLKDFFKVHSVKKAGDIQTFIENWAIKNGNAHDDQTVIVFMYEKAFEVENSVTPAA